ncbi:MAG TPA: hypothetical protein VGX23_08965 [Actinocrinis sp.]|nr:hypothetical protein [Actinocrinis sp.]
MDHIKIQYPRCPNPGGNLTPRITLALDTRDGALLHQAHASSDWVITVDRTLGVEYFDNPSSERHPDYVIDFDADSPHGLGHHIVVSSRSADELQALLTPVIDQHGLQVDPRHTRTFFDQLRLLSGRLAFKLASATATERTEVLGLAFARLYLDYQGVLADQILIPLDAHLDLYAEERRQASDNGQPVGLQRTDLALFSLDAVRRLITCRLVEVKCYSALTGLAAYEQLKDKIASQLDRSAAVLSAHFDPLLTQPDRPDRAVRNAELTALLRSYLSRAVRYGTMHTPAAREAEWLLDRLDAGYRFDITRTGLIFDLAGTGTGTENERGIEYHRIGRDVAEQLLAAIPTDPDLHGGKSLALASTETLETLDLESLPRLAGAAFRSAVRTHTVPTDHGPSEPAIQLNTANQRDESEAARPPQKPTPPADIPTPATPATTPAEQVAANSEPAAPGEPPASPVPHGPEVYLGVTHESPQYGILGQVGGRHVALDLNETHTISLFGVQGGGKSYTMGTIIEAASLSGSPINHLPNPLATIVFHYSPTLDYAPEFTSMIAANSDPGQVRALREEYGAAPVGLADMVMLVPHDQLAERQHEYPDIRVYPLKFGSSELRAEHWRFLMGAIGNQSTYIRQVPRIIRAHRSNLRLDVIRQAVETSALPDSLKQLAQQRLDLAADYIDDSVRLGDLVRPGRVIIVDLRDDFIEKDEALGLFVVLMQLFAEANTGAEHFNKLVVFDEAHKYIDSPDLVAGLVESVREMRHKGMSILVASQDPPSVPIALIELSNHIILHKFTSPVWLKHLQRANASLAELTPAKMASLVPGEAYIWSNKATDTAFTSRAIKVKLRPRATRHGGTTKTAIEETPTA